MATPALRALRNGLPDSELIGIARPGPAALLQDSRFLDAFITYKPRSVLAGENRRALITKLRSADLDAILLLTNSLSSAGIAYLAKIPRRVGYVRDWRGWLLTDRVEIEKTSPLADSKSLVESYLRLTRQFGCHSDDRSMELSVSAGDTQRATKILRLIGFDERRPLVVINNAAASAKSRLWPQQYVVHLCRQLAVGLNCQVLLHSGPNDRLESNSIVEQVNNPLVQSMGEWPDLPLSLSKAILSAATCVVSSDSGPRHIAVALDRPVISLFGSTDPLATQTFNRKEVILESFQECRPCYKSECPLRHHRCMRNIEVDTVRMAIEEVLRAKTQRRFTA